jgi:hydroxymethylbilane synthase
MSDSALRIITRKSPLAMWQACHVRDNLQKIHPTVEIRILGISTEADRFLDSTLASLGGKGAFVKELEHALLTGHADIAVHSMKDVTVELPDSLMISAILARENPGDAFVSNLYASLEQMPAGAVVGTSSLRRQCQIRTLRPDLVVKDIRGNVGTRLNKLDDGVYDALVLANSGLIRLDLAARIRQQLDTELMLPAIGQGALGIEVRSDDTRTRDLITPLNDADTYLCVSAERMVNKRLNGGCHAPIAAYATRQGSSLFLSGLVGNPDGSEIIRASLHGPCEQSDILGDTLGNMLLDQGAGRILEQLRASPPA